jgi:hypothetical protein
VAQAPSVSESPSTAILSGKAVEGASI